MNAKKIIIAVFFILIFKGIYAQDFIGGITAGPVMTQYLGDNRGGYNKLGYKGGFFLTRDTRSSLNYQLELYFIQKGSQYSGNENQDYYNLRLRYIELPFSLQYLWRGIHIPGLIDVDFNQRVYPQIGLSAAYLIEAKEDDNGGGLGAPSKPFYPYDISGHIGISVSLGDRFVIDYRYSHSLLPVRDNPGGQTYWLNRGHYNKVIQLCLNYRF